MSPNFWIVFRREVSVRVRNKLFLVVTLGMPLLLAAVMIIPTLIASQAEAESYEIAVVDPTGRILPELRKVEETNMRFVAATEPVEALKRSLVDQKGKALLILSDDLSRSTYHAVFHSPQAPSLKFEQTLTQKLDRILREQRLIDAGLKLETIRAAEVSVDLSTRKITREGEEETSSAWGFVLGYGMGFISFLMVFAYGGVLMKGVMEEKTNRIVEVIISSVRPYDLMLGKILGIAAVGLLQFFLWVVLIGALLLVVGLALGLSGADLAAAQAEGATPDQREAAAKFAAGLSQFKPSLIVWFIFYFLGGYLLYGCLFAAVGASIDQEADAGPLTTVISIPAYVPILLIGAVMNNPNGPLAVWLSLLPFSSSTIMIARLALVDVPLWQLGLSVLLLVGGIAGAVWVAARIYRVGLLMYGKKLTFTELLRWIRAQ